MKRPSFWVTKTVLPSGPPKVRLVGCFPLSGHLALQRSIGADNGDLAGRQPREINPAVDVGAQAVDLEIRKTPDQPRVEQLAAVEAIGPDLPRIRLADVKRRAVRAQVDPVGHAEAPRAGHHFALTLAVGAAGDAPDLAARGRCKSRVAGIERAVRRDRQVVWLIEPVGMKVDLRRGLAAFDDPDRVLLEIGDVHPPLPIETNAVTDAAGRKRREELGLRGAGRQLADGAALLKIDDVKVA